MSLVEGGREGRGRLVDNDCLHDQLRNYLIWHSRRLSDQAIGPGPRSILFNYIWVGTMGAQPCECDSRLSYFHCTGYWLLTVNRNILSVLQLNTDTYLGFTSGHHNSIVCFSLTDCVTQNSKYPSLLCKLLFSAGDIIIMIHNIVRSIHHLCY